jgi:hypothetical protein
MTSIPPTSLSAARSLTATERAALKKIGIDNTAELLAAAKSPAQEKALAKRAGISVDAVREAVNRADLLQVKGVGAATADLFENAGVNSAAELSHRNAAALRATLEKYAKAHPGGHTPSAKELSEMIAKAKELQVVTPPPAADIDETRARELAGAALNSYIDNVLFTEDPAGANFRQAILSFRPQAEWATVKQTMHDDVAKFVQNAEKSTDAQIPGSFWFSGSLFQLYTDVKLDRTGKVLQAFVEID